jgi:hypothetical protein
MAESLEKQYVALSSCCEHRTFCVPPAFGDKSFQVCDKCHTECDVIYKPKYEKIQKGVYRPIKYY